MSTPAGTGSPYEQRAVGIEDRQRLHDRHLAAQPPHEQLRRARVVGRIGPRRRRELDGAPRILQRAVERRAERADVGERAALDLVLDVVPRAQDREHADDRPSARPRRATARAARASAGPPRLHSARGLRDAAAASSRRTPAIASSGVASPATTAASAGLRSSNSSGVSGDRAAAARAVAQRGVDLLHERRRGGERGLVRRHRRERLGELLRDLDARQLAREPPARRPDCFAHVGTTSSWPPRGARASGDDREALAIAERADLPRPGDPVRDLVRRPPPQLVGRLAAGRRRRRGDVAEQVRELGERVGRAPRGRRSLDARRGRGELRRRARAATARTSSRRRAGRAGSVRSACCAARAARDEVADAGARGRGRSGVAHDDQPVDRLGHAAARRRCASAAPRAASRRCASAGGDRREQAARRRARAARSRRCGSGPGSSCPRAASRR